jgi:hypothetical protein
VLGIRKESLYKLLGRPIVWYNCYFDLESDSASDSMSYSTSISKEFLEVGSCETHPSTLRRMSP